MTQPLTLSEPPAVKVEMMIRRPVEDVFEAFIDPAVTTRFWFTRGSGRLRQGERVRWDWEMYGVGTDVDVQAIEPNRRILIEWDSYVGRTPVEWLFTARPDGSTFVTVRNWGLQGKDGDELVSQALDSTQGFTFLLSAAKAWLEHGIELNVVADKSPDHHVDAAT